MKCPRCGGEMELDMHRKYAIPMCYNCGYMEGRDLGPIDKKLTNFERLKTMNFNEAATFLASALEVDEKTVYEWLDSSSVE